MSSTPKTYAALRDAVVAVVVRGRRDIDRAWLETYHETGRLINEHVLRFRERADYGAKTFARLAEDTGINIRTLRECSQFHRCFPIRRTCAELGWAQCRLLCQVADEARRATLLTQAVKHRWTAADLAVRVRALNATAVGADDPVAEIPVALLTPRRGTPGLHPIVDRGEGPAVDLGFKLYQEIGRATKLVVGDIVWLDESGVRRSEGATKAELFTYAATIRRVVDGDTLAVALAVAPGMTLELKLRLRGLDCPELTTAAGRAAKAFVDDLVLAGDEVVIATTKPDKYDRYLAEVFVGETRGERRVARGRAGSEGVRAGAEVFLNNALLGAGHAVRYEGGAKEGAE